MTEVKLEPFQGEMFNYLFCIKEEKAKQFNKSFSSGYTKHLSIREKGIHLCSSLVIR